MKNQNDSIGNQTHDFPVCSAVPQSIAPPRALSFYTDDKQHFLQDELPLLMLNSSPRHIKGVTATTLTARELVFR